VAERRSDRRQPDSQTGSRADAGPKTESGPLGRVDPRHPASTPPGTVPRPPAAIATGTVLVGLAGLLASLVVLGTIADGLRDQEVFILDAWATPFLHGIRSPLLDAVMNGLTAMGSTIVVLPIFLATLGALYLKRRYGAMLFLSIALGGSLVIDATMKLIFERPRPKLDYAAVLPDYSFPSGHAMNGVAFYVAIALIIWSVFSRRVGLASTVIAAALAIGIGVSRIYLGFHYLTDVVGGWLAGIVWLLVAGAAFRARPNIWPWTLVAAARSRVGARRTAAR
jgi:undecaprenyl-diphosphatase